MAMNLWVAFFLIAGPVSSLASEASLENLFRVSAPLERAPLAQRIQYFSGVMLGRPYVADPLGEGRDDRYDRDPRWRLDAYDCTTFVETVISLGRSRNPGEFIRLMDRVRYEDGVVSFATRNHFTGADWIRNNVEAGLLRDITSEIAPEATMVARTLVERDQWFRRLGESRLSGVEENEKSFLLDELRSSGASLGQEVEEVPYLRKEMLAAQPELLNRIPDGSVLNIVRPNWNLRDLIGTNLNVSHQGFAIARGGRMWFRHASQNEMRIHEEPLEEYIAKMMRSPTVGGLNVLRVLAP